MLWFLFSLSVHKIYKAKSTINEAKDKWRWGIPSEPEIMVSVIILALIISHQRPTFPNTRLLKEEWFSYFPSMECVYYRCSPSLLVSWFSSFSSYLIVGSIFRVTFPFELNAKILTSQILPHLGHKLQRNTSIFIQREHNSLTTTYLLFHFMFISHE